MIERFVHHTLADIPELACRLTPKPADFAYDQAFCALAGACMGQIARNWADHAVNPRHPGPVAGFFSASDGPVEPLSFCLGLDHGHAYEGGVRNRRVAARIALIMAPVTATSQLEGEQPMRTGADWELCISWQD